MDNRFKEALGSTTHTQVGQVGCQYLYYPYFHGAMAVSIIHVI